jgi:hypothetical protein
LAATPLDAQVAIEAAESAGTLLAHAKDTRIQQHLAVASRLETTPNENVAERA